MISILPIVNFPFINTNIPAVLAYKYISVVVPISISWIEGCCQQLHRKSSDTSNFYKDGREIRHMREIQFTMSFQEIENPIFLCL